MLAKIRTSCPGGAAGDVSSAPPGQDHGFDGAEETSTARQDHGFDECLFSFVKHEEGVKRSRLWP